MPKVLRDQTLETDGVQLRAQSNDLIGWKPQSLCGKISQNVDGVRNDEHNSRAFWASCFDIIQDRHEQIGVSIDQIKSAFVRLTAESSRDANQIAVWNVLISAR